MEDKDPYAIYFFGIKFDTYLVAVLFGIDDPIIYQAIKKLLRCGRKHKDKATDVREAITSLERWEEIQALVTEDRQRTPHEPKGRPTSST